MLLIFCQTVMRSPCSKDLKYQPVPQLIMIALLPRSKNDDINLAINVGANQTKQYTRHG